LLCVVLFTSADHMWLALGGLLDALGHLWVGVGKHQVESRKGLIVQSPRNEFLKLV